jgi:cytochrome c-type biogenesis protein CcmH/NrfG
MAAAAVCLSGCGGSPPPPAASAPAPSAAPTTPSLPEHPTYATDVAAILFKNCAPCHRPGEAAPFPLLTYADTAKRARQIAEVTTSRTMPPWLPVEGHGTFVGERRLAPAEIALLQRWHEQGAPEGDASRTPAVPKFTEGWQLGPPDLVVTMPEPFPLPPDGRDVYRNFVLTLPPGPARFVRGVEFRPGNPRVVHHAFVLVDDQGDSTTLDAADPGPGYGGMNPGPTARSPGGHFVSWQPGKTASFVPPGMSWHLAPGARLVVQMHLQTTGRPESVQASVGLYFTDEPPRAVPYKLVLASSRIDVPADAAEHVIESSYRLPVPVQVLGVIPHAHYLGKKLHGFAELPNGTTQWLIRIDDWDFNWQGDYRFATPLMLPAGTVLRQRFTYDNSKANPRNPHTPPRRVTFGPNTTDEMGELWIQALPASREDYETLNRDYGRIALTQRLADLTGRVAASPDHAPLRTELAKVLVAMGRAGEAVPHLERAIALDDDGSAEARYLRGMVEVQTGQAEAARQSFEAAVRRHPRHFAALNALGMLALRSDDIEQALGHFQQAVEAYAGSAATQANLGLAYLRLERPAEAVAPLEAALALEPDNPKRRQMLDQARDAARHQGKAPPP